ncbi:hypothetical protein K431DRAFT_215197 [Polychaeton citri CBS 116435]|uniref:SAM and PH domain-containing protein n=1 Tax=Polychaeton citri CBS 116435 TaxID=1314669 RepID=A0A9P4QH67_9PEZI|nr:hypothetical protein K431DRAFT_215197 [Polychaeton citri CBS 116435]
MFFRQKTLSFIELASKPRPLSQATEIFDESDDDGSEFEEYSPKRSFESEDSRRRSQTTLSSYGELPTPRTFESPRQFDLRIRSVEGPRGPHLFRSSQSSSDFNFDHVLQMSPLFPKEPVYRSLTALSQDTVVPFPKQSLDQPSVATTLGNARSQDERDNIVNHWSNEDVVDWMISEEIDPYAINCFEAHDVTGQVLLNLQFEDLKELDIQSFGKRHEVWNAIAKLKGEEKPPSPTRTPFQDTECEVDPATPGGGNGKKRRGRRPSKSKDVVMPQESVSIVAIEQLLPKPHKCAKGERCAKWRKQQRQLQQLQEDSAVGHFPISPGNGGRIYIAGDPGNATTAQNIVPNVHKQPMDELVPPQTAGLSVIASSDIFGPTQQPEFSLREDALQQLDRRDPQENVKQFLNLQHMNSPLPAAEPKVQCSPPRSKSTSPIEEKAYLDLFPETYQQSYPSLQPIGYTPAPKPQLQELPKLSIPRPTTAEPRLNRLKSPESANDVCRSATASPGRVFRLGTPASEMDVPFHMTPSDLGPSSREASQSVPPSMQFRDQHRLSMSASRPVADWRRPSFALPAVKEGEVFSPSSDGQSGSRPSIGARSHSSSLSRKLSTSSASTNATRTRDPAHHSPQTKTFGYGETCTHAGWMRKRKNRILRHDWQDAHFRLNGTQLAMHASARLSAAELDSFNVDDYAVACSNIRSDGKLAAALKSLHIRNDSNKKLNDPAPFAFQLVPSRESKSGEERKTFLSHGKTHHFAVKSKDERIDWMRELMLAKALHQKGQGYDVEVNGVPF